MVGIAGVLAFPVSSRTQEIGIRMSLGADASRLLQGLLFGVAPDDPVTLGGVLFLLAAVGVVACLLPAVRASRVDPATALRAE